jgi:hypothetical protein
MKEDYYTSTVDGAAGFAKFYAEPINNDYPSSPDIDWEPTDESEEEYYEDDYDNCNCSDPGCPCGGSKRGGV